MKNLLEKISSLPYELQNEKEKILNTQKKYIEISLDKSDALNYVSSKVGGIPYLPISVKYPLDKNGQPMEFLGQINFKDMPKLENYPTVGILQFFISFEDWGLDYDEQLNSDIKVIYYENIEEDVQTEFSVLNKVRDEGNSPISKDEFKMSFSNSINEVTTSRDYRSYIEVDGNYQHYLNFNQYGEVRGEELEMAYWDTFSSKGHKIGGYADFTQQDPRFYENKEYTELLFQLDSDFKANILWGDNGIANFFIKKEDLKNRDFSKVLYNWDCY